MYHAPHDQPTPLASFLHSLNFLVVGSNYDQIQGSNITQVGEQEGEYSFYISTLFQNPPCEDDALPFLDDFHSPISTRN